LLRRHSQFIPRAEGDSENVVIAVAVVLPNHITLFELAFESLGVVGGE
jgi:hypothetical protein